MSGETIGIVGAGRMGSGMAQVAIEAGLNVVLVDVRLKSLVVARQFISENLDQKVAKGNLTAEGRDLILSRMTTGVDFGLLRTCRFCIEVVFENAEVKAVIHSKIRAACGSEIVIASNTVNLSISTLSKNIKAPDKFMGMVFAYPPLTALDVKIIPGPKTSAESLTLARRVIGVMGKNPVMAHDRHAKFTVSFEILSRTLIAALIAFFLIGVVGPWMGAGSTALAIVSVVGFGITAWLAVSLESKSRRLRVILETMSHVAADDLDTVVPYLDQPDSYGKIARLLDCFKTISIQLNKAAEEEEKKKQAAEKKQRELGRLADNFNNSVGGIVSVLASEATELQTSAQNLSDMADQTSRQSSAVAAATEQASVSVQTVASAAEELSASIGEINRQVEESAQVAMNAVDEVKRTNTTVSVLSEAAAQIGDVVKLIQDIAAQTNLLALNATIEAARAGEAGKGFAVVASEVKNLANQTGRATEEISKKISTVQSVSLEAANAIRSIGDIIGHISEISETIAKAIQQQTEATREISNNVQQATVGTNEVSSNIVKVTSAASESHKGADKVLQASEELSKQAARLRDEVQTFLDDVKRSS